MQFPAFEHGQWLAQAWSQGPPRHNLGASGFQPDDPLEGLPHAVDAADVGGLDLHAGTAFHAAVARHVGLAQESVRPMAGTSAANAAAISYFVSPGTTVVCERPYYAPMPHIAQGLGGRLRFVERGPDGRLDPHRVDEALEPGSLVLLTSPNNPTGHALDKDALLHLGESAQRVGAHVLVDQIYAELTDHARAAGIHPSVVVTSGLNKCWGAPGLRAGWVAGDPDVVQAIEGVHRLFFMAMGSSAARIGTLLLEQAGPRRQALARRLHANHAVLRAWAEGRRTPTHGDLVAFLPVGEKDTWSLARRLLQHGILTVPGEVFGRAGHLRLGLGIATEPLRDALDALGPHLP